MKMRARERVGERRSFGGCRGYFLPIDLLFSLDNSFRTFCHFSLEISSFILQGDVFGADVDLYLLDKIRRSGESKAIPAVSLSFNSPTSGFSGLRIAALKVTGEAYSIFKGVRLEGVGIVEVRCQ